MATIVSEIHAESSARASSSFAVIRQSIVTWMKEETGQTPDVLNQDTMFADLAIGSLGVANIIDDLERATGKRLNPEVVFELQTVGELAEYIDALPTRQAESIASSSPPVAVAQPSQSEPREDALDHYRRLNRRINSLKEQNLYFFEPEISQHDGAWVVANGQRMLMLGSYEYLGLLGHPHLKQAARTTVEKYGTGHHGVRLLAGTTSLHLTLEARLARFMRAEDAIVFSSGYVTNLTTISTLVDQNCVVIGDEWNHASIVDGCRMSGAEFLIFNHNDIDSLAEKLAMAKGRRTLVVVDAVYSMDGDIVDLPAVIDLCRKHGALLMVDEAHSLGVLGKTGHGVQEHFGLADDDIDIKMGTLSKTLASIGGFVAGREEIITFLRHHARGYIFSGALPTGQTSAAIAALDVIETEPELIPRLWENVHYYMRGLRELGFDLGNSETPIVPVLTKTEPLTLEMTRLCRQAGLLVIPVAFPAVPLNAPRLRTCVSCLHGKDELDFALRVLGEAGRKTGLIS